MFDTERHGNSLDRPGSSPGDASIALGGGRARLRRRGRGRARHGAARHGAIRTTGWVPAAGRGPEPAGRTGPRAVDRLRGARCHPRARRRAAGHGRGDARWRLERADDARAAARGGGTGGRLDRGLAGPDLHAGPDRGRRARDPARVAGRPDPGRSRGGSRHRRLAAGGSRGGPARHRPAGALAGEGVGWRTGPLTGRQ
ncbi:MAG: hypothetical protein QOI92_2697 [Chloroflexota bacterium]|nr:hypothetical protein [Chloroflexota bacterium]